MRKLAIQLGKLGSFLGALAGLIELSVGSRILPWIGNKESPGVLGFVTIVLSGLAFLSIQSARKHVIHTNNRKLAIFLGILIPATICFTTVGRLWYLPGSLLLLTSILLADTYWFRQSKDYSSSPGSRKFQVRQIIVGIGSLLILTSVALAFFISSFGLFRAEYFAKEDRFRLQVVPMDIVRSTKLNELMGEVNEIEVTIVMFVYIFLIVGAVIALVASLAESRMFSGVGGGLILSGLVVFLIELPIILSQTEFPSIKYLNLFGYLGLGWYISAVGMLLIIIGSVFKFQFENAKR